jgi:hypothetical protein
VDLFEVRPSVGIVAQSEPLVQKLDELELIILVDVAFGYGVHLVHLLLFSRWRRRNDVRDLVDLAATRQFLSNVIPSCKGTAVDFIGSRQSVWAAYSAAESTCYGDVTC